MVRWYLWRSVLGVERRTRNETKRRLWSAGPPGIPRASSVVAFSSFRTDEKQPGRPLFFFGRSLGVICPVLESQNDPDGSREVALGTLTESNPSSASPISLTHLFDKIGKTSEERRKGENKHPKKRFFRPPITPGVSSIARDLSGTAPLSSVDRLPLIWPHDTHMVRRRSPARPFKPLLKVSPP